MKALHGMLLLLCLFARQAFSATPPRGAIVWWGNGPFQSDPHNRQSTGAIESDGDILSNIVAVAAGGPTGRGVLALTSDGTVLSFGDFKGNPMPPGLSNVVSISMDWTSCWAIKRDGTVAAFGGDFDASKIASSLSNVSSIVRSGGLGQTEPREDLYLALRKDGTVIEVPLGYGEDGDVPGPRPRAPGIHPLKVQGEVMSNVAALASVADTPYGLKTDGTVFSLRYRWDNTPGSARRPQLQDNSAVEEVVGGTVWPRYRDPLVDPVTVDGQILSNVVSITGSDGFAIMAVKGNGTVVTSGGLSGLEPAVPAGLSNVIAAASEGPVRFALKRDGTVTSWGDDGAGLAAVPAGLGNVVQIAVGNGFVMALTTGSIPAGVYIPPHGRLEEMAIKADLIFKGQVLSSIPITNESFRITQMDVRATRLKVISVLKGSVSSDSMVFEHYTKPPVTWGGPTPPPFYRLEAGRTYIVFAVNLDKSDSYYSPVPGTSNRPDEFRQIADIPKHGDDGVTRTLDARPLTGSTVREVHWEELNLLLKDKNPNNLLYAIEKLDGFSLAGRGDDDWMRTSDFKRQAVLNVLLPLVTNENEQVANRAMDCFAAESDSTSQSSAFGEALVKVANNGATHLSRIVAIRALGGRESDAVSNSLAQLLRDPDENIRIDAVTLLPQFPRNFAEQGLRGMADDKSPHVRSVVADAIGDGNFVSNLPTLVKLFGESSNTVPWTSRRALPAGAQEARLNRDTSGDVHASAGEALVKFDSDQIADILNTNVNDAAFHVSFIAKLADKDAQPWLPELGSIIESRINYVADVAKSSPSDPRRFSDPLSNWVLTGPYTDCWQDIRRYIAGLPVEKLSTGDAAGLMDLLERGSQPADGNIRPGEVLYELYRTKGLEQRAVKIRQQYPNDKWWFDDFDEHHPELKAAAK